jgi:hypothetical protein
MTRMLHILVPISVQVRHLWDRPVPLEMAMGLGASGCPKPHKVVFGCVSLVQPSSSG